MSSEELRAEADQALLNGSATTFDWDRPKGRPFWLLMFVLLSVVGHGACFYLFRVVYPQQKRELLKPMKITVLDPSDPMTAGVLSRIDDRVVSFDSRITLDLPGEPAEGSPESEIRRTELYVPFYKNYRPQMLKLPPLDEEQGARLFPTGRVFLPLPENVSLKPPPLPAQSPPSAPSVTVRWEGPARPVVAAFEWSEDAITRRPADVYHSTVHIGVDRAGRVVHALPESGAGAEMDAAILSGLRAMRFGEGSGETVDWGWVEVRW